VVEVREMSNFKSIHGGFQMTFSNGLTISVMFRGGNYCEHRNEDYDFAKRKMEEEGRHNSPDAEIAIWDESNKWLRFDYDSVKGWVSADEVGGWITRIMAAKDLADLQSTVPHASDEEE
jgi:hypothetical protein